MSVRDGGKRTRLGWQINPGNLNRGAFGVGSLRERGGAVWQPQIAKLVNQPTAPGAPLVACWISLHVRSHGGVISQRTADQLTGLLVIDDLLAQRLRSTLGDATLHLAVDEQWIY